MRITKLQLSRFRSYSSAVLELDRLNIVRGPHGAGKTSVKMAIEYLLTGRCQITDAAGRGAEDLARDNGDKLLVMGELADGSRITRERNRGGTVLTVTGPDAIPVTGKMAEAWLARNVAQPAVLTAVLDSFRFLALPEKEQKAMLASALASDPVEVTAAALEQCRRFQLPLPAEGKITNAAQVTALHKAAFELRTQINRDLKNLGPIAESVSPFPGHTAAEVRAQLDELEAEQTTLVAQRFAKASEYSTRKASLDAARRELAQYEPRTLETEELDRLRGIAKGAAKLERLREELRKAERALSDSEARLREAQRALSIAESGDRSGKCGHCGQKIEGAIAKVEQALAAARQRALEAEQEVTARRAAAEALNPKIAELGDPEEAQRKIDAHLAAMGPWQRAEKVVKEIGELGPEPQPELPTEEEFEIERRIAKGREIERALLNYEGSRAEQVKQEDRAKKLESHSAELDGLVLYFGDGGPVKQALVGGRLPAFVARINEALERFGFECNFALEPFAINVRASSSTWLRLHQLSESQAFRFSIAFQVALAEATGVNLVVVDRADILLPHVRAHLTDELLESRLDQAFILAASEDPGLPAEFPDGVAFFNLAQDSRGSTTVLAAGGKAEATYAAAE